MGLCEMCGKHNEDYRNYCSDDGKELSNFEKKLMFKESSNEYCDMCGHNIQSNQTYCPGCGKLLSDIVMRTKTRGRTTTSSRGNRKTSNLDLGSISLTTGSVIEDANGIFDDFKNFCEKSVAGVKNFDYVSFAKSNIGMALKNVGLSIGIMTILMVILLQVMRSAQASAVANSSIQIPYIKLLLMNVAFMNIPKMTLKMPFSDYINLGITPRIILMPLIAGCIIYISTRIIYGKKTVKALPTAVLCAFVYSVIMMIITILAGFSIPVEGEMIKFNMSLFSTFINAIIISFVANIMSLEKVNSKKRGSLSNIFKNNMIVLGIMLLIITVILTFSVYSQIQVSRNLLNYDYMYGVEYGDIYEQSGIIWFISAVVVAFMLSPWILLALHFVGIKVAITSVNIFSLMGTDESTYILLVLIPILTFIVIGRLIKDKYGEGKQNIIALYSICYTAVMGLISYFSNMVMRGYININSIDLSLLGLDNSSTNPFTGGFNYTMGSNLLLTIIIVFMFSISFMYIGYRTKKIEN